MTEFTWTITALNCLPLADGVTDYVVTAHWTCNGTDGVYRAAVWSTCSFPAPTGPTSEYTPYADLTQDQVLGWVYASGVDKDATEIAVQAQLDALINPPIVTPPLPWSQA